jgi:lipopolysaccharide/colanic/teichoic acid biosynthesis glycosyltransferase
MAEEAIRGALDDVDFVEHASPTSDVDIAGHARVRDGGSPSVNEVAYALGQRLATVEDSLDTTTVNLTEIGTVERIVIDLTDELTAPVIEIDISSVRDVEVDAALPEADVTIDSGRGTTSTVIELHPSTVTEDPAVDVAILPEFPVVPVLDVEGKGLTVASAPQLVAKRALDLIVAGALLVVFSPFLIVIALLVALTSRGPILYRSERVGKDGETFVFLKFRSMYRNADDGLEDLRSFNEQSGPVFKIERDPRVTPLGRLLRRSSVDELPQLFHVLSGKMSMVGPRPALASEVAQYDAVERQRLLVKPGITCIWQVSGRSTIGFDTWVDMDLDYIRSWSLPLDLVLMARTVPAVLSGRGAY